MRNAPRLALPGLALLLTLFTLALTGTARARDTDPAADYWADRAAERAEDARIRVGAVAGVGFPRVVAVEGLARLGRLVAIGAEYGALPGVSVAGVSASLWSVAGDVKLFPFKGSFFVGVRGGSQHLEAAVNTPQLGVVTAAYDSWFVNPSLGILFTAHSGITVGIEVGAEIPLSGALTTNAPPEVPLDQGLAGAFLGAGRSVLPTIDLLRLGVVL